MEKRILGRTNREVSVVGMGAWQIGGAWGDVSEADAMATLNAAVDSGVTLIDTADVYGDGRSETFVGRLLKERSDADLFVATKMGRALEQTPENYSEANFRMWLEASRQRLGVDTIDLAQLHCPPTEVFKDDKTFDVLDSLVDEKLISNYGVSVETCEQALIAIARPNVASVQIIFNAFRQKPLDEVLPAAQAAGVGILARVPLASGLLSGKYTSDTKFSEDDHRNFNRNGEQFDVGETFAGVDFETGLQAVEELRPLVPVDATMAQWALRWVLDQPGVTTVIPGARNPDQANGNAAATELSGLNEDDLAAVRDVYDRLIRPQVHSRW